MIGNPTPIEIPFVPEMQLRRADVPNPIAPQPWHFRQSIEYSMTNELRHPRHRVRAQGGLPLQHVQDGRRTRSRRGSRDHWTMYPKRIDAVRTAIAQAERRERPGRRAGGVLRRGAARSRRARSARLHPAVGSSRLPDRDQVRQHPDQGRRRSSTARPAPFTAGGKSYPAGSYVVKAAQAFRAHVMDMFEPQDHPNDIPVSGRSAAAAVRRHRLQPVLLDGDRVRSHPRRLRRAVREAAPT